MNAHTVPPRPRTRADTAGVEPYLVIAVGALLAGVLAQGGFYLRGRLVVLVLALLAAGLALAARSWARTDSRLVVLSCAALSGWALLAATAHTHPSAGLPVLTTLAGLLAGLLVAHRAARRELIAAGLVGVGLVVAVTGWVGVAWRVQPWASVVQGLWRAATPITYANASAAILTATALLVLGVHTGRPRALRTAVPGYLLLVGLAATLSRAGLLTLVAGLVVLAVTAGPRPTVRAALGPLTGALLAGAALVPAVPASAPARPGLAVAGLVAGLALTAGLTLMPYGIGGPARGTRPAARRSVALRTALALLLAGGLLVGVAATAAAALGGSESGAVALDRVSSDRAKLESSERSDVWRASRPMIAAHPLTGVGPGHTRFVWHDADGHPAMAMYAHDEYLQILVDLGAVGLALLLLLLFALGRYALRGRPRADEPDRCRRGLWAGAVAALVALAGHSAADFLWQLPVIPLLAGLLAGLAGPNLTGAHTDRWTVDPATTKEVS